MMAEPETTQTNSSLDEWLACAAFLAMRFNRQINERDLANKIAPVLNEGGSASLISDQIGEELEKDLVAVGASDIRQSKVHYPLLAWTSELVPFIVVGRSFGGRYRTVCIPDGQVVEETIKAKVIKSAVKQGVYFEDRVPLDVWEQDRTFSKKSRWFWGSIVPLVTEMRYLLLATLIGNLLAVMVSLFAMQVWDRVIPSQSLNSLTVLAIGVIAAVGFDLLLKIQRAALIDEVGKSVDVRISSGVFSHMLELKSDARPPSLGTLAAQVRELNQIRDAIASSMLSAAIELPFIALYLLIIYFIGGSLVYPIIAVIPVVIVIGLISQFPLSKLAVAGMEESNLRNGLIVEAALKADEIKLQQSEPTVLMRWEKAVDVASDISIKQRRWRTFLSSSTQSLQQLGYIFVVALGAVKVIAGDVTMGQVIACSILANRSIAPLNQLTVVMSAFQNSRVAKRSIDEMMARVSDTPTNQHLRRTLVAPDIEIRDVSYAYPGQENAVLRADHIEIKHGEKIAVIGRIGSGKSTLLRLISGLGAPSDGTILMDGTDAQSIHPGDLRKSIGYLAQGAPLFRGTVRDNLAIARPAATDEELMQACEISGALRLIQDTPQGLDLLINEAGNGLSGGQKQALLLARTVLRDPPVVLLDEPTASMDDRTELEFVRKLNDWVDGRTLIIATHRMAPLQICDRLIVVNRGKVVLDGPKEKVMRALKSSGEQAGSPSDGQDGGQPVFSSRQRINEPGRGASTARDETADEEAVHVSEGDANSVEIPSGADVEGQVDGEAKP